MINQKYDFLKPIFRLPFVKKVILFGSRARGDNQKRADYDLAIICPDADENEWQQLLAAAENLNTLSKLDLHKIDSLESESAMVKNIVQEGITLYVKEEGTA